MPSKRKKTEGATGLPLTTIPPELLDQVVKGPMTPAEVQAVGLLLKKAIIERAMSAHLTEVSGKSGEGQSCQVSLRRWR